jgi:hypothetical protein
MIAGKGPRKVRVRTKYAGKSQLVAGCLTPFYCRVCKPDYNVAFVMGLHPRLGEASPVAALTEDLMRTIIEMTKSKRQVQVPLWMSCDWIDSTQQRRGAQTRSMTALALTHPPDCNRVCCRDREACSRHETTRGPRTQHPSQTAQEKPCNRLRAPVT